MLPQRSAQASEQKTRFDAPSRSSCAQNLFSLFEIFSHITYVQMNDLTQNQFICRRIALIKTYTKSLSTLAMIALFGATGCPNNDDNNTSENNTSENNLPDMSVDVEPDTDSSSDVEPDTGEETNNCVLLNASPRTLPMGGDAARITWSLSCAQPIEPDALEVVAPRELSMELEIPTEGLCQPAEEGHTCTFSANGLTSPEPNSDVQIEAFELTYGPEKRLSTDVRWHYTPETLRTTFGSPAMELDEDYVKGGLGILLNRIPRKRQERIRAAYKEQLRSAELRVVMPSEPPGNETTTALAEVNVVWDDLIGQNLESIRFEDGSTETLWWGYDAQNNRFVGAALGFNQNGDEAYNTSYSNELTLEEDTALVSILDARAVSIERSATPNAEQSQGVTIFLVGLNASGNVVFHVPFGEVATAREFDKGSFFGLDEAELNSKTFGFVKQQGNVADRINNGNDDYVLVWSALPNASKDKLNIKLFPSFAADDPGAIVTTELDTGFEVTETYVSQSSPGSIIVLAHGAKNARAMYRLSYDTETNTVKSYVELALPDNVDVRPSECSIAKKDTPKKDTSWECLDPVLTCDDGGELCGDTDHFRTLGRWPWNWRELKEARATAQQPMVLDWNDDGTLNTVFPMVLEPAPTEYTEGAPIIITELGNGRAFGVHTTSLSDEACKTEEDCFVEVADSIIMGPGKDAPTFYMQGKDKPKKVKDTHRMAEHNRAFAHFGRKRTKSKRVIAPVVPGTSSAATHVLMDMGTTEDSSDTVNSAQLNITINGAPIDANLVLHGVVPHMVGDKEELVMVFRPLAPKEGMNPTITVVSISGDDIDAALAKPNEIAAINTIGAPLEFEVHPSAIAEGDEPFQVSLIPCLTDEEFADGYRTAPPTGEGSVVNALSTDDAQRILVIYPSPQTGALVVGGLSKKIGADDYTHSELALNLTPEGSVSPAGIIQANVAPGSHSLSFSASPGYSFLISRRAVSKDVTTLDVVRRDHFIPLSDQSFKAATYETGDFNGDGIEDYSVDTNFAVLLQGAALSEDVDCTGCVVYFGDGLGGFLEASMNLPSGPVVQWGIQASSSLKKVARRAKIKRRIRKNIF